ncbi:unnamed protein product [Meganyctiphanes norvegica]|uniref:GAS2-like protein 1 n=1 Tax=Meganyctiphanes norvegica TaxID=48144 RepID=A0AAV2R9U9_MEGNR
MSQTDLHKPSSSPAPTMNGHHHNTSLQEDQPDGEKDNILMLERRSFKPFKTSEEYLYAMKEDLAEWLHNLYALEINVDNFFEVLETGQELCLHSNNVRRTAEEHKATLGEAEAAKLAMSHSPRRTSFTKWDIPNYDVVFRSDVAPGSFFARDNVHNFITWCRDLGIMEVLLFETDDLVLRKNEKHVILSLLEVARRGARFGVAAPLLIQMEVEIDREVEREVEIEQRRGAGSTCSDGDTGWDTDVEDLSPEPPKLFYGPQAQVITNDLRSLDEMVRDLVERCTCPLQFPMIKVSDGKYRIGDTRVLIFVRILRNHVMVRVGGGWDTLEHYLDKHDPCRCKAGHRTTISSRVGFKTSSGYERTLSSVTYERCEEGSPLQTRKLGTTGRHSSGILRRDSSDSIKSGGNIRHRSESPAGRESQFARTGSGRFLNSPRSSLAGGLREDIISRNNNDSEKTGWCDSSSEVSDEGYKSQGQSNQHSTLPRYRKPTPKKMELDSLDPHERPESVMTQLSSEGSTMSTEDVGNTPPRSPTHLNKTSNPLSDTTNTWNHSPSKSRSSTNIKAPTPKSKIPYMESLRNIQSNNKKTKKTSIPDEPSNKVHHPHAWGAGPGQKEKQRRNSVGSGQTLSRSRSATSEGGLMTLTRDSPAVCVNRSPAHRRTGSSGGDNNKGSWSGRTSKERPTMHADMFRPPAPRNCRSASASPATTRRRFGSSAPATPIMRSPKRSAPSSTITSPTRTGPVLDQLADLEPDENTLLCIKDIYDSLRAKVSESLAAEGKSLPPELNHDYTSSWINAHSPSGSKSLEHTKTHSKTNSNTHLNLSSPGVKASPRKDGGASRIPKPTFFSPRQT